MPDNARQPIILQLTQGQSTVIDDIDTDLMRIKWHAAKKKNLGFYAKHSASKGHKSVYLHQVILERVLGRSLIKGEEVDHIDRNTLNNSRSNLRLANRYQNGSNRSLSSNNKSGYRGVCFKNKKWVAKITVHGRRMHLGYFDTPEEAYKVYCLAAIQYFGDYSGID